MIPGKNGTTCRRLRRSSSQTRSSESGVKSSGYQGMESPLPDSNREPLLYKRSALPVELSGRRWSVRRLRPRPLASAAMPTRLLALLALLTALAFAACGDDEGDEGS